jgi:O-antigen/teichoic acid export membrane protein
MKDHNNKTSSNLKSKLRKFILVALAFVLIIGLIIIVVYMIHKHDDIDNILTFSAAYLIFGLLSFFRIWAMIDLKLKKPAANKR